MQFKQDTRVYGAEGEDVGHVDRVVLNPQTKEVTHIVIRRGTLFMEDKIFPLRLIDSASEDGIILRLKAPALDMLPLFEETHYIPLNEEERRYATYPQGMVFPLYWYLPRGERSEYAFYPPAYRPEVRQNIPDNAVAVKEGARVITSDSNHVGDVEHIFTDGMTNQVTHFLISQGFLLKERKFIPVSWVRNMTEDEVYLNVSTALLNDLQEYQRV